MLVELLKWSGLLLLLISLLQSNIHMLWFYGLASTVLLFFAYTSDIVLVIIHVTIIGVYIRNLKKASKPWSYYLDIFRQQLKVN